MSRLFRLLLSAFCSLGISADAIAQTLVYQKEATREATWRASVEATLKPIPPFRQGPWWALGDGRVDENADGPVDTSAKVPGPDGKPLRWARRDDLADAAWHTFDGSVAWLYRRIESPVERQATFTIGSDPFINIILNGRSVQAYGTTSTMPDRKGSFGTTLRKGTNHLLVRITGPGGFSYELSPLHTKLLRDLEERLQIDFPIAAEGHYYRIETVDVPESIALEVGGLAVQPGGPAGYPLSGALVVATRRGELWAYALDPARAGKADEAAPKPQTTAGEVTPKPQAKAERWHLFASGLHEPLGLWRGDVPSEIYVMQRPELTRVVDSDGDGVADRFETLCDAWGITIHQHEYLYGPLRDREGNFWGAVSGLGNSEGAHWLGWSFRVTPQGEFTPWSTGLRSPNGMGFNAEGDLFIADNQGDYVGTSPMFHVTRGAFHGHPRGLLWDPTFHGDPFAAPIGELDRRRKPAAVLFPYGSMGQSLSQILLDDTGGKFGPFAGQLFIGDQSKSTVMRVTLEKIGGEYQGACYPFRSGFQSGNNRMAFAPDGSLYVGQTDRGWGSIGGQSYGLQRLVWTEKVPMEIHTMALAPGGFDLAFTKPVDPTTAENPAAYSLQHYHYLYHATYGSPQVDNTPVTVKAVRISADRRRVALDLPEIVPGRIYELNIRGLKAEDGTELLHPAAYYTANRIR